MRISSLLAACSLVALAACSQQPQQAQGKKDGNVMNATAISQLTLPTPSAIKGKVTAKKGTSFMLNDGTGTIEVDTDDKAIMKDIKVGQTVGVVGVVDEDDSMRKDKLMVREFDAYEIVLENGKSVRLVPWK